MTVRGPIASLPLVAEPEVSSPDQVLVQSARFNSPDVFPAGNLFRGPVTLTESARLPSSTNFRTGAIAVVGVHRTLTQSSRLDSTTDIRDAVLTTTGPKALAQSARLPSTVAFHTGTIRNVNQVLTQTTRLLNSNIFPQGSIGEITVPPIGTHPPIQVGFPPDGSGDSDKKKRRPNVRIKWRDTVAEAEARLLEEQRLAEIAQLKAFEAYLIRRRKIAAATVLLMS